MSWRAHLSDSVVYGHLWTTPELHRLFDDRGRTQAWLDVLTALAHAQADLGLIPAEAAKTIESYAQVDRLDLDEVGAGTRATGHSTAGLIQGLRALLPESAREWVYYGATVQDVSDSWFALVMRAVADVVERDLARCEAAAVALAARHRDTPMCGRTHGQPGLPITFGFKAAVWAAELRRHRQRLAQARPRFEVVQLGGALGTMEFWGPAALDLLDGVRRPARPRRPGHPVDHRPGRRRGVPRPARAGHRDARQDRQRDLRAAAPGDRRGRRAVHPGHRRQHHDAAQAQPGAVRAPGHAGPDRAGGRRGRRRGAGVAARAGRPRLEGRVVGAARGQPAHRGGAARSPRSCWRACRSTPTGCAQTWTRTAATCPPSR